MEEPGFEPCRHREHSHEHEESLPGEADILKGEGERTAMNKVLRKYASCQVVPGRTLCPRLVSWARCTRSSTVGQGGQGPRRGPERDEVLRDL